MFCPKCGAQLNENFRVCPKCGAMVQGQDANVTNNSTYNGPLGDPKPVLVFGILSLSFALTFFMSFLGIIFGIIGLKKANAYNEFARNAPAKQATIGRKLSLAGLITGSVMTGIFLIYIIAIVALVGGY